MKEMKKILGVFVLCMIAILCLPNNVKANEKKADINAYLDENGKFKINAVKPTTEEDFGNIVEFIAYDKDGNWLGISFDNPSKDFSEVDLTINADTEKPEKHRIKLDWNYDENVNKVINNYLTTALRGKTKFKVSDLELVSYWLNNQNETADVLSLYSGELRELLDYKNIQLFADSRAGNDNPFITSNMGFGSFKSDGVIYKIIPNLGASADHVIYVDENVGNTKEDIINAVQKRIDDYFGKNKVTIEFAGENTYNYFMDDYNSMISYFKDQYNDLKTQSETANANRNLYCNEYSVDYDENMCNSFTRMYFDLESQASNAKIQFESYESYKENFIESWNESNGEYEFLKDAYNGWYFWAHMQIGDRMYSPLFVVKKDSSKMVEPFVKTTDINTNIEISTKANLPIDTIIQAKELINGKEYERILKILNLTDNQTFDLKLYSNSTNNYITKLEDGTFKVKIPVPESFKGKDLVVYYVKENGEKETYTVDTTTEPGYAIFTTKHFSIYTLGYKESGTITIDANGGVFADGKTTKTCSTSDFKCWTEGYPTREGYKFTTYRSEDGTSLGLLDPMPSGITLLAQWEKADEGGEGVSEQEPSKNEEEVPKTFDGITNSIIIGTISLIGLVGTTIYLNKKRKIRNNN